MITQQVVGVAGVVGTVLAYALYKSWQLKQARKITAKLEVEKQQQAVEIERRKVEVKHAHISRQNYEKVARSSASDVDNRLHQHGYFRDDHGLHGVHSDLPEPCGHSGDETSSACTQSDL